MAQYSSKGGLPENVILRSKTQNMEGFFFKLYLYCSKHTAFILSELLLLLYAIIMQFNNAVQVVQDCTYYTVLLVLSQ